MSLSLSSIIALLSSSFYSFLFPISISWPVHIHIFRLSKHIHRSRHINIIMPILFFPFLLSFFSFFFLLPYPALYICSCLVDDYTSIRRQNILYPQPFTRTPPPIPLSTIYFLFACLASRIKKSPSWPHANFNDRQSQHF